MSELDEREIADKYNSLKKIWDTSDKWHYWTYRMIASFIKKYKRKISLCPTCIILNAGSGGNSYGFNEANILHIDIAKDKIAHLNNSIVGSIENIPKKENSFDLVLCVGSVINYCDPMKTISEFARTLRPQGYLVLEFENSNTLELIGTINYNKKAVLVDTFYFGDERIWYYSTNYIQEILELNNFSILKKRSCHIISPLIYRITRNEKIASYFGYLDSIFRYVPIFRKNCSNTILLMRKN